MRISDWSSDVCSSDLGVAYLKPMTLRQVADAIEMHESTVSRVTSNKYLICARGPFELKYFFTSAIQAADGGDAVSAEAVKSAIRALIAAADPTKIERKSVVSGKSVSHSVELGGRRNIK